MANPTLTIGVVAGEKSGDILGSGLMNALTRRTTNLRFIGVGGDQMIKEGLEPLASIDDLSVNGFVEPLKRLPTLVRIIGRLYRCFKEADVVVGIDFNVFNLLLERLVKRRGVPTAHYVSPAVYAWRRSRIRKIGRSTDVVMALFPFEPPLYRDSDIRAEFVGHPLADEIDPNLDVGVRSARARVDLGLPADALVIGLLPGSRLSEVRFLGNVFVDAAALAVDRINPSGRYYASAVLVIPCVSKKIRSLLTEIVSRKTGIDVRLIEGASENVIAASDVVLTKAGTSTLEALLLGRPMVVSYRLGGFSYWIAKRLIRSEFVALPNILAGYGMVPELLQSDATPDHLANALVKEIERFKNDEDLRHAYRGIHRNLRCGASERAAEVVMSLVYEGK
ncbi:MAG: lipid-A-disaccharide synthase [Pseudomonadales bacterium]|nr:lipid-A-disaccharide synthase [Pseudomonadales bacterium]